MCCKRYPRQMNYRMGLHFRQHGMEGFCAKEVSPKIARLRRFSATTAEYIPAMRAEFLPDVMTGKTGNAGNQ